MTTVAEAHGLTPGQLDALWFEELELAVGVRRQVVDVEIGVAVVGRFHDRGWRGHDQQAPAFADPIQMPVAVHDDDAAGIGLEHALKPAAVDERGPDAFGERRDRHRIFDQMMVQRHDPAGFGIMVERGGEPARMVGRNHS